MVLPGDQDLVAKMLIFVQPFRSYVRDANHSLVADKASATKQLSLGACLIFDVAAQ
jgi:hypothetical protein